MIIEKVVRSQEFTVYGAGLVDSLQCRVDSYKTLATIYLEKVPCKKVNLKTGPFVPKQG